MTPFFTNNNLKDLENDHFDLAMTGEGEFSFLEITNKMRTLVPETIETEEKIVQITGEVVAPLEIENARNYAAGALNLKDIEQFKKRRLLFVAYSVEPNIKEFYIEDMAVLDSWLFDTCLTQQYDDFPQDGTVWRIDSNEDFEDRGYTAHHPRGAFALKTRKEAVITTLQAVEWQVGKSGVVSPVAILEPVQIDDATISRATLHNISYIESLNLEIGCEVKVIRSGDIIPRITGRVEK